MRMGMLGTRVARRIVLFFSVGAALPVVAMTVLSAGAVTSQLRRQGEDRLELLASIAAQSILERLASRESTVRALTQAHDGGPDPLTNGDLPPGVAAVAVESGGTLSPMGGAFESVPGLSAEMGDRLAAGRPVLALEHVGPDAAPELAMAVPYPDDGAVSWARIDVNALWDGALTLLDDPTILEVCVLTEDGRPLFCRSGLSSVVPASAMPFVRADPAEGRAWADLGTERALLAWKEVFLRSNFGAPSWTVLLAQTEASVTEAAIPFGYNFALALLIGVSAVLLLSNVLVRRTMEPLRALSEGTRQLAEEQLSARVPVQSDDEFGDLAVAFNRMAENLDLHVRSLEAGRAIDRSATSAADHVDALEALIAGLRTVLPDGRVGILAEEAGLSGATSFLTVDPETGRIDRAMRVGEAERNALRNAAPGMRTLGSGDPVPEPFASWAVLHSALPLTLLTLEGDGSPAALVAVSGGPDRPVGKAEADLVQELLDRAAVVLGKLRADKEIEQMSWESLRALANAIDAKSAWTTGHSERVTGLALLLGEELGLDFDQLETLHRGGLLHDVGKIAVPTPILDFDGALDEAGLAQIRMHPEAGVRILEPIRAFRPILPIVRSHHERWDGNGYPDGLAGEAIPFLARVLAVADVFDAMVSARPYRAALDPDVVAEHIRGRSGSHFDPRAVRALDAVLATGWTPRPSLKAETA